MATKSQFQHSLGPWAVLDYTDGEKVEKGFIAIVGPNAEHIGDVFPFGSRHGGKNKEIDRHRANARLMAAAPDMLVALQAIVHQNDRHGSSIPNTQIAMAKEAIAKARGHE